MAGFAVQTVGKEHFKWHLAAILNLPGVFFVVCTCKTLKLACVTAGTVLIFFAN